MKTKKQAKPKTAYELLERVCEHITEEPKRYDQNRWLARGPWAMQSHCYGDSAPRCQTVACRAGWIVLLHDGLESCKPWSIPDRANQILGLPPTRTQRLFASAQNWKHIRSDDPVMHAREGVRGLRVFMNRNAKHLKARLLKGV